MGAHGAPTCRHCTHFPCSLKNNPARKAWFPPSSSRTDCKARSCVNRLQESRATGGQGARLPGDQRAAAQRERAGAGARRRGQLRVAPPFSGSFSGPTPSPSGYRSGPELGPPLLSASQRRFPVRAVPVHVAQTGVCLRVNVVTTGTSPSVFSSSGRGLLFFPVLCLHVATRGPGVSHLPETSLLAGALLPRTNV